MDPEPFEKMKKLNRQTKATGGPTIEIGGHGQEHERAEAEERASSGA